MSARQGTRLPYHNTGRTLTPITARNITGPLNDGRDGTTPSAFLSKTRNRSRRAVIRPLATLGSLLGVLLKLSNLRKRT